METVKKYTVIVIGAGAGGLVVAIGSAKAGKNVLLIEKGSYGGDCTNFGCIPSKTLIASAEQAHALQMGDKLGLSFETPQFDPNQALERVRKTVEGIRSHEDPEALAKLGVETMTGTASFLSPTKLKVTMEEGSVHEVEGKKIIIATGSHPFVPPIQGLEGTPYLTNETIFDLKEVPKSLGVLGAGPIGCELAQAFNRLGSKVTLIESERGIMPVEDEEVNPVIRKQFEEEGIEIFVHCDANLISHQNGKFQACIDYDGEHKDVEFEEFLISTGRRPNVAELQLEKAGVHYSEKGIPIDQYGRTNQKHIFALGDVLGGLQFTHVAESQGRAVLTSLLLPFKKKFTTQDVPRCTYTDPEVASIGLTEAQAIKKYGASKLAIYKVPFSDVDRALTAGRTEGFVKVVTKKWSSKILGAVIVAPRAGEMLPEISLAMLHKIPFRKLANLIHAYPVYNRAIRKGADQWLTRTLLGALKRKK